MNKIPDSNPYVGWSESCLDAFNEFLWDDEQSRFNLSLVNTTCFDINRKNRIHDFVIKLLIGDTKDITSYLSLNFSLLDSPIVNKKIHKLIIENYPYCSVDNIINFLNTQKDKYFINGLGAYTLQLMNRLPFDSETNGNCTDYHLGGLYKKEQQLLKYLKIIENPLLIKEDREEALHLFADLFRNSPFRNDKSFQSEFDKLRLLDLMRYVESLLARYNETMDAPELFLSNPQQYENLTFLIAVLYHWFGIICHKDLVHFHSIGVPPYVRRFLDGY